MPRAAPTTKVYPAQTVHNSEIAGRQGVKTWSSYPLQNNTQHTAERGLINTCLTRESLSIVGLTAFLHLSWPPGSSPFCPKILHVWKILGKGGGNGFRVQEAMLPSLSFIYHQFPHPGQWMNCRSGLQRRVLHSFPCLCSEVSLSHIQTHSETPSMSRLIFICSMSLHWGNGPYTLSAVLFSDGEWKKGPEVMPSVREYFNFSEFSHSSCSYVSGKCHMKFQK
jgi:hypothetical protein